MMQISEETYFSPEAEQLYIGHSQFCGFQRCEAAQLAKIRGEYAESSSTALLVGSFVDSYFSGSLPQFKAVHPEICKRDGSLKSEYVQAEDIILRIERDPFFMAHLDGEKQRIMTGEIEGVPVKIKIDCLQSDKIVDLKIMRDFNDVWNEEDHCKQPFIIAWGYDIEAAMYQEIVRQNTGERLPFIIAAATKESEPNIAVGLVPQDVIDTAMETVLDNIGRYAAIKAGLEEPERCEHCDYCKSTKVLTGYFDFMGMGLC